MTRVSNRKPRRFNKSQLQFISAVLLIITSIFLVIAWRCPTNTQKFLIYSLVAVGIIFFIPGSAEKTTFNFNIGNAGFKLVGGVAFVFILFYFDPIGHFKKDDCDLKISGTGVTIFVFDAKKGPQDMILRQKGSVIMDVNGARLSETINEKGMAFFQNLHDEDKVKLNIDFTEPYKSVFPDSTYTIFQNSSVYLPVTLKGLDKVKGIVLYKNSPLPEVTIAIESLKVMTDSVGNFTILIPDSLQKQFYNVWFIKKGFKTKKATATPETQEMMEVLMEK